jgi:ribonuclease BN (tRNA processing enzyme)
MGLTLKVYGSSGSEPRNDEMTGRRNNTSGYLVESTNVAKGTKTSVLLDMGHGIFPDLESDGLLTSLDAIFITHAHLDHFIDLLFLWQRLQHLRDKDGEAMEAYKGRIPIYCTAKVREILEAITHKAGYPNGSARKPRNPRKLSSSSARFLTLEPTNLENQ